MLAVARDGSHRFSKPLTDEISLIEGLGVEGDAHAGATVQHRSRVAADPSQLNLRQIHLVHAELHDELRAQGFEVAPGQLGENVTTQGVDLLGRPRGIKLLLGRGAVVEVTGLRDPCQQINDFQPRLLRAVLDRDAQGNLQRKAGIMGVVVRGGVVRAGDSIGVELPMEPHRALDRV